MLAVFVSLSFLVLYLLSLPGLLAKEYRRDLIVFSILMLFTYAVCLAASMGVSFPYISEELMQVFPWVK